MPVERFNDLPSGGEDVAQTGTTAGQGPTAQTTRAVGTPNIDVYDPAANLRADATVYSAGYLATPTTAKAPWLPTSVDHFDHANRDDQRQSLQPGDLS